MSIHPSILFLVGKLFKMFTNSDFFWLYYLLKKKIINSRIYLPVGFQMHDLKRIFHIFRHFFLSKLSSNFKHNTVIIQVTENGSGLTLGQSGTLCTLLSTKGLRRLVDSCIILCGQHLSRAVAAVCHGHWPGMVSHSETP